MIKREKVNEVNVNEVNVNAKPIVVLIGMLMVMTISLPSALAADPGHPASSIAQGSFEGGKKW